MPKLTPFNVVVSKKDEIVKTVTIKPLVNHSGGKGPNWTIGRKHSPGGPGSVKFNNKKDVGRYFERRYPESKGYSVEVK